MSANRYFNTEESNNAEVFTIGKKETQGAIKNRKPKNEFKRGDHQLYAKKKRKGNLDRFPGRAPIQPQALEKHQYSDGVDPKKVKSKFAQKMAAKREKDRKRAHEIAARTEILLQDDAGFLEPDSDDEFT